MKSLCHYWRLCFVIALFLLSLEQCRSIKGGPSGISSRFHWKSKISSTSTRDSKSTFEGDSSSLPISPSEESSEQEEREQLYEAYNLLHTLAQDFKKPFDAPAVIVVGHQTSGKSALIEALMGFQFNQVGGGTKTRRPIALRMQYNPTCTTPVCFLTTESGKEEARSLSDIQAYIEAENKRLEKDPSKCFESREINIRMEYKYCPNMIVVDTPGMLHAPKGRQLTPQQRALAQAAREAEALVLSKIRCPDYIILCVEDTTDWKHATTRNIVMSVDPELSRTVLVTTKLDTKIPQFSEAEDLEDFLKAPLVKRLFPRILGGPYFTSVPSGRVGNSRDFSSNEAFVKALRDSENLDNQQISEQMGSNKARGSLPLVGVSKLRSFLERQVEECYRRNVAKIIPVLQHELRNAESKLDITEKELEALSVENLRERANIHREKFVKELSNLIHGTVKVSPEEWGETLEQEQMRGGSFVDLSSSQNINWPRILESEVSNSGQHLFGGAQYHRSLREFTAAVRHLQSASVTEDEIANAAGLGDVHDGVNFMRAAAVIAMEKAQLSFDPMLEALKHRSLHIMKRLFPIVEQIIQKESGGLPFDVFSRPFQSSLRKIYEKFAEKQLETCLSKCRDDLHGMTRFVTWDVDGKGDSSALYKSLPTPKKVVEIYKCAVQSKKYVKKETPKRSIPEDKIMSEWVSANTGKGNGNSNSNDKLAGGNSRVKNGEVTMNPSSIYGPRRPKYQPSSMDADMSDPTMIAEVRDSSEMSGTSSRLVSRPASEGQIMPINYREDAQLSDYYNLLQLMEELVAGRNANRTSSVVTALVQYIIRCWRDHYARTVAMKFNCFFLLPFLDEFPTYLRNELDKIYSQESNLCEMFDIHDIRQSLLSKRNELLAECQANLKIQTRFDRINAQLRKSRAGKETIASMSSMSSNSEELNNTRERLGVDEGDWDANKEPRIVSEGNNDLENPTSGIMVDYDDVIDE